MLINEIKNDELEVKIGRNPWKLLCKKQDKAGETEEDTYIIDIKTGVIIRTVLRKKESGVWNISQSMVYAPAYVVENPDGSTSLHG